MFASMTRATCVTVPTGVRVYCAVDDRVRATLYLWLAVRRFWSIGAKVQHRATSTSTAVGHFFSGRNYWQWIEKKNPCTRNIGKHARTALQYFVAACIKWRSSTHRIDKKVFKKNQELVSHFISRAQQHVDRVFLGRVRERHRLARMPERLVGSRVQELSRRKHPPADARGVLLLERCVFFFCVPSTSVHSAPSMPTHP